MTSESTPLAVMVELLDRVEIPYMVVGSFASSVHGDVRTTLDLDMVIDPSPDHLDTFLALLDPEHYYVDHDVARDALRRRTMFNVIVVESAWKIDLIIRKARPFSIEELRRRTRVSIKGDAAVAATAEDTIIAKLEWAKAGGGSERQLGDIQGILRMRSGTLDLAYIGKWVVELGLDDEWARAQASVLAP